MKLASTSYLVSISSREQVAQIKGKPIYVITDVALIPLSSRSDAQSAITHARNALKQGKNEALDPSDSDSEDDTKSSVIADDEDEHGSVHSTPTNETPDAFKPTALHKATTVVSDVIQNKGSYGRFANRWFSKAGWKDEGRRKQGMSSEENLSMTKEQQRSAQDALPTGKKDEVQQATATTSSETSKPAAVDTSTEKPTVSSLDTIMKDLTPRILTTTKLFFASRSFFFSYDYDISRSLSRQESGNSSLPLYKRFDPLVSHILPCTAMIFVTC